MLFCQKLLVATSVLNVQASRQKSDVSNDLNIISSAKGHLDFSVKESQPHMGGAGGCKWPAQLKGKYSDPWVVGTGATACVWIGKAAGGNPVAIKVAKGTGNVAEWKKECNEMQSLRLDACKAGGKAQQLAEMFVPTCMEVGQVGSVSYYVMQAAGTRGISDFAKTIKNDVDMQKRIFAQTVAAVYSLHGIGWTHNDLHGHNIVVDDTDDIALIDFGEIKGHHRGLGYKHDVNSVWRWAAVLGNCPEDAQYPRLMKSFFSKKSKDELTARSKALLKCMKSKWNADQEFLTAFEAALTNAIKITEDQKVEELFNTKFIQKNLPPLKNVYPWTGNGKCSASGLAKKELGAPKAPKRLPGGRPTKGDRVKVKTTGKCAEIIKDDKDDVPYKVKYDDGKSPKMLLRVVQVAWASECL